MAVVRTAVYYGYCCDAVACLHAESTWLLGCALSQQQFVVVAHVLWRELVTMWTVIVLVSRQHVSGSRPKSGSLVAHHGLHDGAQPAAEWQPFY